jgi:hypothetical protein
MGGRRTWAWVWDMNGDGRVTIRDAGPWAIWLFLYPGDFAIFWLTEHWPATARFLELSPASYGGGLAVAVSIVAWTIPLTLLIWLRGAITGWRRRPRILPPRFPEDRTD